jgi:hypothetical protein
MLGLFRPCVCLVLVCFRGPVLLLHDMMREMLGRQLKLCLAIPILVPYQAICSQTCPGRLDKQC